MSLTSNRIAKGAVFPHDKDLGKDYHIKVMDKSFISLTERRK